LLKLITQISHLQKKTFIKRVLTLKQQQKNNSNKANCYLSCPALD